MIKLFILFALLPLSLIAFEMSPVTPYPVLGYKEIPFYDDNQQVDRTLLVWYPVDPSKEGTPSTNPWDLFQVAIDAPLLSSSSKRSLIVTSHGYAGNPHQLSWLIRWLVHRGHIVIAVQHRDLIDGKVHANHWQRAQDITTIIDRFLESPFASETNQNQIGIAGYSLGGTTSVWIAGGRTTKLDSLIPGPEYASPVDYSRADEAIPTLKKDMMAKDWQDARVKAAFIIAPAWSWLFDEESLRSISIPTYFIAADRDKTLVTRNNAGFFAKLIPHALYQTIPGKADHFTFISALDEPQKRAANPNRKLDFLFFDETGLDRTWIQYQTANEAANFFRSTLTQ